MTTLNINFTELTGNLQNEIIKELGNISNDIKKEISKFIDSHKADVEKWTNQCINNTITRKQLEKLLTGLASVAEMHALKKLLIAQVKAEEMADKIILLVVQKLIVFVIALL